MARLISARAAAGVLLLGLIALAVFHVLVMVGVFPPGMVWGGRAGSDGNALALEFVALLVTLLFAVIVAIRTGDITAPQLLGAAGAGMWLMFAFFALSAIGSLLSLSSLERAIFTPVGVVLALMALRLALEKREVNA